MEIRILGKKVVLTAISICAVIVLLLPSCNEKPKNNVTNEHEKWWKTSNVKEDEHIDKITSKADKITNELNSLLVKSLYKDGKYYLKGDLIDKLVFEQEIQFLFEDNVLKKFDFPVQKLTIDTGGTSLIKIQENIVNSISIVKGEKGWIYQIYGGGILPNQTEFYGLYSPIGELLWYSYTTYQNYKKIQPGFSNEGYGNLDNILEKYKISEVEFNNPKNTVYLW